MTESRVSKREVSLGLLCAILLFVSTLTRCGIGAAEAELNAAIDRAETAESAILPLRSHLDAARDSTSALRAERDAMREAVTHAEEVQDWIRRESRQREARAVASFDSLMAQITDPSVVAAVVPIVAVKDSIIISLQTQLHSSETSRANLLNRISRDSIYTVGLEHELESAYAVISQQDLALLSAREALEVATRPKPLWPRLQGSATKVGLGILIGAIVTSR